MRFLADAGISPKTIEFLRRSGHDAIHVRELAMQRAPDRALAEKARADNRILLTLANVGLRYLDPALRACQHSIDDRVDLVYDLEIIDHRSKGET